MNFLALLLLPLAAGSLIAGPASGFHPVAPCQYPNVTASAPPDETCPLAFTPLDSEEDVSGFCQILRVERPPSQPFFHLGYGGPKFELSTGEYSVDQQIPGDVTICASVGYGDVSPEFGTLVDPELYRMKPYLIVTQTSTRLICPFAVMCSGPGVSFADDASSTILQHYMITFDAGDGPKYFTNLFRSKPHRQLDPVTCPLGQPQMCNISAAQRLADRDCAPCKFANDCTRCSKDRKSDNNDSTYVEIFLPIVFVVFFALFICAMACYYSSGEMAKRSTRRGRGYTPLRT